MQIDMTKLLQACKAYCYNKGFPINSEDEYQSAIHDAIISSVKYWKGNGSIVRYAKASAFAACKRVYVALKEKRLRTRRISLAELDGLSKDYSTAEQTLCDSDLEIIAFVAAHGRARAAKKLGISSAELRNVLDAIFSTYQRNRS